MSGSFSGKVVIITGGSAGIGQATAEAFARDGAKVVVAARRDEPGEAAAVAIRNAGGHAIFVKADVAMAADAERLVDAAVTKFGRIDCAINNAGVSIVERLHECTEDDWDYTVDVNLKGVFLCMKYQLRQMLAQREGVIVNVSSAAGLAGFARSPSYAASKHGVIGLTKSAALQYANDGIRINAICPGLVMTPMAHAEVADDPESLDWFLAKQPTGQAGSPQDIADALMWLCSDKSRFVNGSAVPVDGGVVAGFW